MKLQVYSDIRKLQAVLLHRPGRELENLTPNTLQRLLFDDIPHLRIAQQEHDEFSDLLRSHGAEVYYIEDLVSDVLSDPTVKQHMLRDFIHEANLPSDGLKEKLYSFYDQMTDTKELADQMIAGVRKTEVDTVGLPSLYAMAHSAYPLFVDPMPNMYFTRDPFATVGGGVTLNRMRTVTRCRETLFAKYVFEHHSLFKEQQPPMWYDRLSSKVIEGGDILVLSEKIIAIGISQRTDADAIESFAKKIFASDETFETILAFDIPKSRAFMHLDTVFTMVDHDAFTIHPGIEGPLSVFALCRTSNDGDYEIVKETADLETVLKRHLGIGSVRLIRCGGDSSIDADREQWNDGSNTLAIAPGEVVVYDRNHVTNKILKNQGIITHEIASSELSRGRGGPRCMSMALRREK